MENTIAFTYNPYTYFESYKNVLGNLRKHYETSDVFIYFDSNRDDIKKYESIANDYKCFFIIRENPLGYINRNEPHHINKPKMIEWFDRIINTANTTKSKWILNLEDDVLIKRKILIFPNSDIGTCRFYLRPGGGSIFNRNKFLESIKNINVANKIDTIHNANWAGDILLENIFKDSNATFEEWVELAEPNYRDNTEHAVFHGYKELHKLG